MGVFNTENTNLNTFMALESSPGRVLFRKDRATEVEPEEQGYFGSPFPLHEEHERKGTTAMIEAPIGTDMHSVEV